ncbi:hypothetical protein U3516DRAFT_766970 [Neocallimastix sp. 'constans']
MQNVILFDSHMVENIRVYMIKTSNTVDLRFDYRYFYAKQHSIKKVKSKIDIIKVSLITKKNSLIIEFDMDKGIFVKEWEDKWTSNRLYTFNSIVLASFQLINIDIFLSDSNTLMRKYHNGIKQNILNEYKGNLIDIGSRNELKNSDIKNSIIIYPNTIQNIKLKNSFNIATCFFALNDFNYNDVEIILFNDSLHKELPVYLLECDNIMFVNFENSNLTEHYENVINNIMIINDSQENHVKKKTAEI